MSMTASVSWAPTPTDAPKMYNDTAQNNTDCYNTVRNPPTTDPNNFTPLAQWNETLPEYSSVCTFANATYVYPCCQAFGGTLRLGCSFTACMIQGAPGTNDSIYDNWTNCSRQLAQQLNGSTTMSTNCQPAYLQNENLQQQKKKSSAKSTRFAYVLGVVTLAAAIATAL